MGSISQERMFVGNRVEDGEKVDPAAISAYGRIKKWTRSDRSVFNSEGDEYLATLAANVTEGTLYELTKRSDCVRGKEISLSELRHTLTETYDADADVAVIVGMQEAIKAVVKLDRSFGSD